MAIGKFLLRVHSVNNRILLAKYIHAYKNISMQLVRYVCVFLKYPSEPKVAFDLKYNFILSIAIFPLWETVATIKFEPSVFVIAPCAQCVLVPDARGMYWIRAPVHKQVINNLTDKWNQSRERVLASHLATEKEKTNMRNLAVADSQYTSFIVILFYFTLIL